MELRASRRSIHKNNEGGNFIPNIAKKYWTLSLGWLKYFSINHPPASQPFHFDLSIYDEGHPANHGRFFLQQLFDLRFSSSVVDAIPSGWRTAGQLPELVFCSLFSRLSRTTFINFQ